jgi:2-amino-4-hydroxy-6-hydroxymethyldihydropteridine diphosphokinase
MILIGLGANLPDAQGRCPRETVTAAIAALAADPELHLVTTSRLWESAPVPVSDQPWFVNAVARVETGLSPRALLERLHAIETGFGRVRRIRWEARVLDLDLLAYDDLVCGGDQLAGLTLPHPRIAERAFVLRPLSDIAPAWHHPLTGEGLTTMVARLDTTQICRPVAD